MSVAEAKWDHYQLPDSVILLFYSGHQEESDEVHNMYFEKSLSGGIFNLRMYAAGKKILTMSSVCLWSAHHTEMLGMESCCSLVHLQHRRSMACWLGLKQGREEWVTANR